MSKRPETGPMKFGDDWPGVFIRGDNAYEYATIIEATIKFIDEKAEKNPILTSMLREFKDLLVSSDKPVNLIAFNECLDDGKIDFLNAPPERWLRFRDYESFDLWLGENELLWVLFPDGTVAQGLARKRNILRSDRVIKAWGVVVDNKWYDLIDLKVDRYRISMEFFDESKQA